MDEVELLKRAQALDSEAFAAIFDRYYESLYRYLYHHLQHRQTAEDLAAQVFYRLLEALQQHNGPTRNLKAWLYRVAHHLVVDDWRRQAARQHLPLEETFPSQAPSLEGITDQALLTRRTRQALEQLNERQRDVLVLRFLQGLSLAEVAEIYELKPGAIKALQHRALITLRRELSMPEEIE